MEVATKTPLILSWENVSGWTKPSRKMKSKKILDSGKLILCHLCHNFFGRPP